MFSRDWLACQPVRPRTSCALLDPGLLRALDPLLLLNLARDLWYQSHHRSTRVRVLAWQCAHSLILFPNLAYSSTLSFFISSMTSAFR